MKAEDLLKQLGITDEQLKSFAKLQRQYRKHIKEIKDKRYSFGITDYIPVYTPRKLVNRFKGMFDSKMSDNELIEKAKGFGGLEATMTSIKVGQKGELKRINETPIEAIETIRETLKQANQWRTFDYSDETINKIIETYAPNYKGLLDQILEISDTFNRYDGADLKYINGGELENALNILEVLVNG